MIFYYTDDVDDAVVRCTCTLVAGGCLCSSFYSYAVSKWEESDG